MNTNGIGVDEMAVVVAPEWIKDRAPTLADGIDIDMMDTTDVIELTSEDFGRVKAVLENPGEPNAKLTRLTEGDHE